MCFCCRPETQLTEATAPRKRRRRRALPEEVEDLIEEQKQDEAMAVEGSTPYLHLVFLRSRPQPLVETFLQAFARVHHEHQQRPQPFIDRKKTVRLLRIWQCRSQHIGADITHGILPALCRLLDVEHDELAAPDTDAAAGGLGQSTEEMAQRGRELEQSPFFKQLEAAEEDGEVQADAGVMGTGGGGSSSSSAGVLVALSDGSLLRWASNAAFDRLFLGVSGLLNESMARRRLPILLFASLLHPDDRESWFHSVILALFTSPSSSATEAQSHFVKAIDRDGRISLYLLKVTQVRSCFGNAVASVGKQEKGGGKEEEEEEENGMLIVLKPAPETLANQMANAAAATVAFAAATAAAPPAVEPSRKKGGGSSNSSSSSSQLGQKGGLRSSSSSSSRHAVPPPSPPPQHQQFSIYPHHHHHHQLPMSTFSSSAIPLPGSPAASLSTSALFPEHRVSPGQSALLRYMRGEDDALRQQDGRRSMPDAYVPPPAPSRGGCGGCGGGGGGGGGGAGSHYPPPQYHYHQQQQQQPLPPYPTYALATTGLVPPGVLPEATELLPPTHTHPPPYWPASSSSVAVHPAVMFPPPGAMGLPMHTPSMTGGINTAMPAQWLLLRQQYEQHQLQQLQVQQQQQQQQQKQQQGDGGGLEEDLLSPSFLGEHDTDLLMEVFGEEREAALFGAEADAAKVSPPGEKKKKTKEAKEEEEEEEEEGGGGGCGGGCRRC